MQGDGEEPSKDVVQDVDDDNQWEDMANEKTLSAPLLPSLQS